MLKIYALLLLTIANVYPFNACQQPYKYNMAVSPFFANENKIDSMIDANGHMARYEYDGDKVSTDGLWKFDYTSKSVYSGVYMSSNTRIDIFNNGSLGYDSIKISNNNIVDYISYFRFTNSYDVFENWESGNVVIPVIYDSVAYYNNDSLYHFKATNINNNIYEYTEGCKSSGDSCQCKEIFKTQGYPITIIEGPIYVYSNQKLVERKQAKIFYSISSSVQISSSSYLMSSSSSLIPPGSSTEIIISTTLNNRIIENVKSISSQYDLNGRTSNKLTKPNKR